VSQWLWLLARSNVALLAAEFHSVQDLLEAGMLADIGKQKIDAQLIDAAVALAHRAVEPLDSLIGFAEDGVYLCGIECRERLQIGVFE